MLNLVRLIACLLLLAAGAASTPAQAKTASGGYQEKFTVSTALERDKSLFLKGKTASNRTSASEKLFTGEQYDATLNNYYLRARYYNQQVGRFTQQDTYMGRNQDPVTLHKYLYANVDPVNVIDPTGKFGMGSVMSAVNIMSTLVTTAQTVQSVFNVATGKEEMPTARQIGTTIVVAMLGGAAAKVIIKKLSKMADKNSDKVNLANAERTFHILNGEGKGRGGHKLSFKTLFNGKSKFPAHWSSDRIMHAVSDVATNPKIKWKQQTGSNGSMYTKAGDPAKFVVEGVSDGIKVRVIVEPAGRGIVTAFPIK